MLEDQQPVSANSQCLVCSGGREGGAVSLSAHNSSVGEIGVLTSHSTVSSSDFFFIQPARLNGKKIVCVYQALSYPYTDQILTSS